MGGTDFTFFFLLSALTEVDMAACKCRRTSSNLEKLNLGASTGQVGGGGGGGFGMEPCGTPVK